MQLLKAIPAGAIVAMLAAWPANAQDMTGAELHALLDGGHHRERVLLDHVLTVEAAELDREGRC